MEKFNLEYQYQIYLKRMGLVESKMHKEQKKQIRETFFGASGQMLILLRDEISELEENKGIQVLEGLISQVVNFFLAENNRQN